MRRRYIFSICLDNNGKRRKLFCSKLKILSVIYNLRTVNNTPFTIIKMKQAYKTPQRFRLNNNPEAAVRIMLFAADIVLGSVNEFQSLMKECMNLRPQGLEDQKLSKEEIDFLNNTVFPKFFYYAELMASLINKNVIEE